MHLISETNQLFADRSRLVRTDDASSILLYSSFVTTQLNLERANDERGNGLEKNYSKAWLCGSFYSNCNLTYSSEIFQTSNF